jgi:hypothetical protein
LPWDLLLAFLCPCSGQTGLGSFFKSFLFDEIVGRRAAISTSLSSTSHKLPRRAPVSCAAFTADSDSVKPSRANSPY